MQTIQAQAAGEWQTVELTIPATDPLCFRPVDRPAVIELREITICAEDDTVVWAARTLPELQNLSMVGSFILLPQHDSCLFFSFGSDPAWQLPALNEVFHSVTIRAVLLIHQDFTAVSEAISAIYAEMDLMTAQVRTAAAARNKTVRDLLRKADEQAKFIELERQRHLDALILERKIWEQRNAELQTQRDERELEAQALRRVLHDVEASLSWRLTGPLRSAMSFSRKLRKSLD